MVLAAALAVAAPVVLQPELRPGRTVHGRSEIRQPRGDPAMAMPTITVLVSREATGPDAAILTMRTPLPSMVGWVHQDLFLRHRLRYREDGGVAESELLRSDLGAVFGWLGLTDDLVAHLPSEPEVIAATGCSPLGFQALLPRDPVEVGGAWEVGEVGCELVEVHGSEASVRCRSEQVQEDPWAVFTIREERELEVDLAERMVTACTSTRAMRRELDPSTVHAWSEVEEYEAREGSPVEPGLSLVSKLTAVAGAGLAGVLGLLLWLIRRARR